MWESKDSSVGVEVFPHRKPFPTDRADSRTQCVCSSPLLMDETVIGMGVNCLKCGRSAERHLTPAERRDVRERERRGRRRRIEEDR